MDWGRQMAYPNQQDLKSNYSFFTIAWITGRTSVIDSAPLGKRVPLPRASSRGFSLFQLRAPGPRRFVLRRAQIAKGYCKRRHDVGVCPPPPPPGDATGATAAAAI